MNTESRVTKQAKAQIEANMKAQQEAYESELRRKARFEALREAPTEKLNTIDGSTTLLTAEERLEEAEKIYNWLIK